jgi:galactokinase/mevalonate kinase-like predicted kinase
MMKYSAIIPARINMLGNPTDANEGDYHTISCAINVYAGAYFENSEKLTLEYLKVEDERKSSINYIEINSPPPLKYDGNFDLVKSAINRLMKESTQFRERFDERKVKISIWSKIPRESGLGGSSCIILLVVGGLRVFYKLDSKIHNPYFLAEVAQRAEEQELGITCGFADRYVPLFGGIAYLDYRGKLEHHKIKEEPYVTYERLDEYVESIPLIVASTGISRDSGNVHHRMRKRYLEEYRKYMENPKKVPYLVEVFRKIGETAWRGKIALLEHDWKTFGELMNENHRLIDEAMKYCGYEEGAGKVNNELILSCLESEALGAKLSGAGLGGSIFCLVEEKNEERVIERLKSKARELKLKDAKIFRCKIDRRGLLVRRED